MHDERNPALPRHGVVAVIQKDARFLVIRRSRFVRAPWKFCFPGGGIEASESPRDAITRELSEELNVSANPIQHVWSNETASGVALAWWTVDIETQKIKTNPAEVEAYHWLSVDDMMSNINLLDTNRAFLSALRRGEIAIR
ncbi:MAG: NUDIX domain-containing protein [Planctomycetales bacterium]|nr:NUDIX domain-containing protein [Planctomycetales bacterium]